MHASLEVSHRWAISAETPYHLLLHAGTEPITITIYNPHETPSFYGKTFKNAHVSFRGCGDSPGLWPTVWGTQGPGGVAPNAG